MQIEIGFGIELVLRAVCFGAEDISAVVEVFTITNLKGIGMVVKLPVVMT